MQFIVLAIIFFPIWMLSLPVLAALRGRKVI